MESEGLLKEEFGLNSYESKVYLVLLRRKMKAAEIAEASGVPQSRTYDTVRALAQKGFVSESEGTYAAVKPSVALRARLARFGADFAARQAAREAAMKKIVALTEPTMSAAGSPSEPVMLRGMDSIAAAFLEVIQSSDEVFLVVRKGLRAESEFLGRIRGAGKVGPKIRVLIPSNVRLSARQAEEAEALGLKVRRSSAAVLDMMVGDSHDVIIGVPGRGEDEPFRAVGIWLNDKSFSSALSSALEALWREASP